jgi:hypothetical protein
MEPRLTPEGLTPYLEHVLDGLLADTVQLWEIPVAVSSLFYLGESCARRDIEHDLAVALHDRDRYYRAACDGGFSRYLKRPGRTHWELCQERGEHERAARVRADMESLVIQVEVSYD